MIGQTVSHYRILEKLGEGGMGVVYKAEDTKLKRTVALKFLSAQAVGTKEERIRFVHEAQAAAALNHPNICTIHEIDEREGQSFIAMECIEGESLKSKLESGPLKLDEAIGIIAQAAEGLKRAQDKGIVHRDIKTANIMVTAEGQAKIMDFGLAKAAGMTKVTRTGTTVGTLAYMSPEQARGEEVDHRSDIWSLGVVLYELLTGKIPFEGDHEAAMVYSIMNEGVAPPSDLTPEVPSELDSIVAKMLQKNPDDRYASAGKVLSDLRKLQSGLEVKVALPMSRKAKRALWGVSAVVVIAAVITGFIILNRGPTTVSARTLAVVDFNIIGGEDAPHLAEGLAEGISAKLSKLQSVRVASSDDIRRLRRKDMSAKEVATKLDAQFALGGSLLRTGEQIRVTPQLIDASTGDVIWSELFDREFSDVFQFLDEVSLKIVAALELELDPAEKVALEERPTESPEAYEHYLKGRQYYYRATVRDNENAVKEFQKALRLDPDYPLALAGLADAYAQRYKERYDYDEYWLDEADRLIERALELKNDLAEAYESRAEVLLEKESFLAALESAQKARDLRPDWDEPYLRLGEIYERRGEGALALKMFNKALDIRPSVEGWCGRGQSFEYPRGLVDSAEVAYSMAAKHNPDHDRPFFLLGYLYYYSFDDLEEAERMLRRAIEVRPDRGRSYDLLKDLLCYGKGSFQEAEELIRGFAEKYPYHYDAYSILFRFLDYDKGELPAALKVAEDAVAQNPDRVWPHLLVAEAYADQRGGDIESKRAVEAVQKALEKRPESGRVLLRAGHIYRILGDPGRALQYYRRAEDVSPGSPTILAYMAYLLITQAHFDSAATVAANLARQMPRQLWGYGYLRIALTHLMRVDEVLPIMQDAADKYGEDNPWFFVLLGEEQCRSGRYQEAEESYNRILDMRKSGSKIDLDLIQDSLKGLGIAQWLSGDTESALASFSEAAETESEGSYTLYNMMVIPLLKYLGRFDEIEARLGDIRADGLIDSWVYHAHIYYPSMRRFDEALSAVEEALESEDVTWKPALILRTAAWHRQKGDLINAEKVFSEIEPSLKRGHQNMIDRELAAIEAARGNLERALQFARKAHEEIVDQSDRNESVSLLSRLYYAQGRTQDALDVLAGANGLRGNIAAFYQRAQMAIVTQSPDADKELGRAFLLATRGSRSDDWWWGLGRARIYAALASARLGDAVGARSEIEYAVKLEPERADIAYMAAAAYALVGDSDEALDWLQTAVERGHQELWWARVDPDLDPLRELPRFKEIMGEWERRIDALIN